MVQWTVGAFADEYAPDLQSQLEGLKKLGISCMEPRKIDGKNIADLTEEEATALAAALQEAGITVPSLGSPLGKGEPQADLAKAPRVFRTAQILGASYCRVFSFYGLSEEETFSYLDQLLTLADGYGITLCHENEAKIYGESPEACLRLLEHFGGRLKAVFDMGNFVLGGYDPLAAYELLKPYVAYFHIKDAAQGVILPPGEGEGQVGEILRRHGDAYITLEPHLFDHHFIRGLSHEQLNRAHVYETPADAFTAGAEAFFRIPAVEGKKELLTYKAYPTRAAMGRAAGLEIARCLRRLLAEKEEVNVIFAAAPSQNETLWTLREQPLDWHRINAYHMDEYIGLPADAPQCFSNFLEEAIFGKLPFKRVFKLNPANDPEAEMARYTALLKEYPVDVVCMGIGENGHIAFNDPGVADFADPAAVKRAKLDPVCRTQQVHDGCFASLEQVPEEALTLTVPALMAGKHLFCMVPAATKREAVTRMLTEPVNENCPCTVLRTHPSAILYCDADSLRQ